MTTDTVNMVEVLRLLEKALNLAKAVGYTQVFQEELTAMIEKLK